MIKKPSMIKNAMVHYFWLYNSITDMLKPYIEVYKKYHKDLRNAGHISITIQDNAIWLNWAEYWSRGGYEDNCLIIDPKNLGNCPEDFEEFLKEEEKQRLQREKELKEKEDKAIENQQRKQYEFLKEKFEK